MEHKIGHLFRDVHHQHVTCLDFSDKAASDNQYLAACSEDGILAIYDCLKPALLKSFSVSDVAHVAKFTHSPSNVLMATSKKPAISYLSLNSGSVGQRYALDEVARDVSMSSSSDSFLTATDSAVMLWDLRSPSAVARLSSGLNGGLARVANPRACYDPQGQVFALTCNDRNLRLYDARNYQQGPFASFEIVDSYRPDVVWSSIAFSPDGSEVLIASRNGGLACVVDSFEGNVTAVLQSPLCSAAYLADNSGILMGCPDGSINHWSRSQKFKEVACIEDAHLRSVSAMACNGKLDVFATACTTVALWIRPQ
jgi:COMPASS component SWD2